MNVPTLHDIPDLNGKKVIVRVDFNVPIDADTGEIKNDTRIQFAIPTLKYLLEARAAQLIVITHAGRPKNNEEHLKTNKIAERLGELLGETVVKVDDWGEGGIPDAKVLMLENIRFHPAEKSKDEDERDEFGKQIASHADLFVNEAFSNSHRAHASMTSIPKNIPGYVGIGVEKEITTISKALEDPEKPLVLIIAGLKADKLKAIKSMLTMADKILVGGALAYAIKGAEGKNIGDTKVDSEGMDELSGIVSEITSSDKVLLPIDAVVADAFDENANSKVVSIDEIENGWMALDIGSETTQLYVDEIKKAKTVLWFGPVGVFEMEPFSKGTKAIGQAIADSEALSIVGGGDSATAVKNFGLEDKMSHVSTGGGASLTMIEGKPLPAIEILKH